MNAYSAAHWVSAVTAATGLSVAAAAPVLDGRLRHRRQRRRPSPHGAETDTTAAPLSALPSAQDFIQAQELAVPTWSVSRQREAYLARRSRGYLSAVGGGLCAFSGANLLAAYRPAVAGSATNEWRTLAVALLITGALVVAYSLMPYLAARSAFRHRQLALASARVDQALSEACSGASPLGLPALFQLNRRQLDEYQLITRKQQKSAFLWAQLASAFAFLVLVAGIVVALTATREVDKYISGGLSGLGAALSAFIAATFFNTARDANSQMNLYYLEPQRTGRLLSAERLIGEVTPATDAKLLADIVTTVLSWEMPEQAPAAPQPSQERSTGRESDAPPPAPADPSSPAGSP